MGTSFFFFPAGFIWGLLFNGEAESKDSSTFLHLKILYLDLRFPATM